MKNLVDFILKLTKEERRKIASMLQCVEETCVPTFHDRSVPGGTSADGAGAPPLGCVKTLHHKKAEEYDISDEDEDNHDVDLEKDIRTLVDDHKVHVRHTLPHQGRTKVVHGLGEPDVRFFKRMKLLIREAASFERSDNLILTEV